MNAILGHIHLGVIHALSILLLLTLLIPVWKVSTEWLAQKVPVFAGLATLANAI